MVYRWPKTLRFEKLTWHLCRIYPSSWSARRATARLRKNGYKAKLVFRPSARTGEHFALYRYPEKAWKSWRAVVNGDRRRER